MKSYPAPPIPERIVAGLRQSVDSGASQEELIRQMRGAGLSMVPSITLLSQFFGIPISEAKRTVHCSQTWSDRRVDHDNLHESALQAVREIGAESRDKENSLQTA